MSAAVKAKPYVPTTTRTRLFSDCQIATNMEAGLVGSKTRPDPADWRRACVIAAVSRFGDVRICSDEFHDEYPMCRVCRLEVDDIDDLTADYRCVNEVACIDRKEAARLADPKVQMWAEIQEAAAITKAEENGQRAERQERTPKVRPDLILDCRCEHCGEPTKGGKFVAGHDAKLKGLLLAAAKELDVDAYAEMVARSWVKDGTKTAIHAARVKSYGPKNDAARKTANKFATDEVAKLVADAEALIQATSTHVFLSNRVLERVGR